MMKLGPPQLSIMVGLIATTGIEKSERTAEGVNESSKICVINITVELPVKADDHLSPSCEPPSQKTPSVLLKVVPTIVPKLKLCNTGVESLDGPEPNVNLKSIKG